MLQTSVRLVEYTAIRMNVEGELGLPHARWLRGAIGGHMKRPEFHHHAGKAFVYQHPLIRYVVCERQAMVLGLAEGAFLLRNLPALETLRLGPQCFRVLDCTTQADRLELGPCPEPVIYRFQSPYLALNQENHAAWQRSDPFTRRHLLERVVVGNLLSLAKAVGLHVSVRLHAEVDLVPDGWHDLKPGVRLLGFRGALQVNFLVPDDWGIGKSSARGFGTLTREEARHGQE
jgi:hypothetical protein